MRGSRSGPVEFAPLHVVSRPASPPPPVPETLSGSVCPGSETAPSPCFSAFPWFKRPRASCLDAPATGPRPGPATLRRRPCAPEFRGRHIKLIKLSRSTPVPYGTYLYSTFCLINNTQHIFVKMSDSFLFCKLEVCTPRVMLPKAPRICARVRRENREGVAWTRTAPRHSNSLLLMSINNTHQRACHCAPARSNALSDTA
jgi:hypothetical protein